MACSSATPEVSERAIAEEFAVHTITPACDALVEAMPRLRDAVNTFVAEPNAENLRAAQAAWLRAHLVYRGNEAAYQMASIELRIDGSGIDATTFERDISGTKSVEDVVRVLPPFAGLEYLLFEREQEFSDAGEAPNPLKPLAVTAARFVGDAGSRRRDAARIWADRGASDAKKSCDLWETERAAFPDQMHNGRLLFRDRLVSTVIAQLNAEALAFARAFTFERRASYFRSVRSGNTVPELQASIVGVHALYQSVCRSSDAETCESLPRLGAFVRAKDGAFAARWEAAQVATEDAIHALPTPLNEHLSDPETRAAYRALRTEHCAFAMPAAALLRVPLALPLCEHCSVCDWEE